MLPETLLGFEYYILQQFKLQQKKYVDEEIKLGCEMLSVYHHCTKEFVPLTEVYSTWGRLSGPSWGCEKWCSWWVCGWLLPEQGEEHHWTAPKQQVQRSVPGCCWSAPPQSGNQQLCGQKLENSNLKVCSVLLDLACRPKSSINDPCSCSCLCVKVTGPYWDMINSKSSGYLVLDPPERIRTLDNHIQLWLSAPLLI